MQVNKLNAKVKDGKITINISEDFCEDVEVIILN